LWKGETFGYTIPEEGKDHAAHGMRNEMSLSNEVVLKLSRVAFMIAAMRKRVREMDKGSLPS
jgi:uncharacterized protein YehS (DUF1456 family)